MNRLVQLLRSAALARAVLIYLAVLGGVAAWLPWVRGAERTPPPGWAVAVGLARPFSSAWFLAGVAALFASTLACTWGKRARTARLWRGELPAGAAVLGPRAGRDARIFLQARGFGEARGALFRYRHALWGGWILHIGLLALIAGVGVQQAFQDGGSFELVPGERRNLAEAGFVFARERGPLAPSSPPDLEVELVEFDPFRRQPGYAPDRSSRVVVRPARGRERETALDRAAGVHVAGVDVYQAIPSGLALVVEAPGALRALHLRERDPHAAAGEVSDEHGAATRVVARTEGRIDDPAGTGAVELSVEAAGASTPIALGQPFTLGGERVRAVALARWAGFTYARSPGTPAVLVGFGLVLLGAALLAFPAGVARLGDPDENAAAVHLARGAEALREEWERGAA